jgi:glycerophosphoryl diester phosphodiesterase
MMVFGHRGVPSEELENTIRSFKKAEALGVDMIEMDLRVTRDQKIVIYHDWNLKRLYGINQEVKSVMLEELKEISKGEIPTLEEVLAEIKSPLNLHIKVSGMEAQVLDALKNFPHRVLISSVFPKILKKFRALDGNIRLGLIIGGPELHLMFILNWLVRDLNLYSIHPKNILVSFASMPIMKWQKRKVIVWDVKTKKDFDRLSKLGADGIITDFPQKFISI